jgi:hypothetical protein
MDDGASADSVRSSGSPAVWDAGQSPNDDRLENSDSCLKNTKPIDESILQELPEDDEQRIALRDRPEFGWAGKRFTTRHNGL